MEDKLKQWIGLLGGALGALLLFLQAIGVSFEHFNNDTINALVNFLTTLVPLILIGYGIWKNQYLISPKAKEQEEVLIKEGLKKE